MFWSVMACIFVITRVGRCEMFPSLMSNTTMAIVIDKEYLGENYGTFRNKIEEVLEYTKREILKHGGVYIQMFTWPAINIKRDYSALLSITSCKETWRLYRAAKRENLLHIAISEHDCARLPQNIAITIPIIERGQETPQLLLDLRTNRVLNWKHTVIIYDNFITDDILTRVIKALTKQTNQVGPAGISLISLFTNFSAFNDVNIREVVKAKLTGFNANVPDGHFMAIVTYELVEIIMEHAKELQLTNANSQWLYLISDTNSKTRTLKRFKQFLMEGDNVAFIYNNTLENGICNGGISCHIEETLAGFMKGLDDAIVQEYEMASQVSEEEWEAIRPTKSERTKYLLDKVKKYLTESGTCDNCTKWKFETGETWGREYQVMQTDEPVARILPVGTWRPSDGVTLVEPLFPHVAQGFRGRRLPLVSFHNPPWQILKTNASGDVVEFGGIVFNIINELAKNLNFTYSVEIVKSHNLTNASIITPNYGANKTNSFMDLMDSSQITTYRVPKSILELVHNKTVAMGACAFTVTEENKKIINFTSPISIQAYKFLVARPKELSRASLFISPFRGDTWICLSATIICMGPILFYVHKLSPVYEYKGIRSKGGLATVQNCIWYMYGALLQQGGMHLPYADSARIIVGAWWLVVLVIGTTYCGNLVAYLTFPKIEVPITTLDDLIERSDAVSWSYSKNSFFEAQLKISSDETYKKIYKGAKEFSNKRNMIAEIKAGRHVYIDWKIKLQYMIKQQFLESDRCDFALGSDDFSDEQIALIVAPHTPYLSRINQEIKKLHQMGLIQKWLEDYLPKKDKCWKKKRSVEVNNHTVNLDDMQGSFFVLFIGCFLSALVIAIEKLWHKKLKDKKRERVVQPFIA